MMPPSPWRLRKRREPNAKPNGLCQKRIEHLHILHSGPMFRSRVRDRRKPAGRRSQPGHPGRDWRSLHGRRKPLTRRSLLRSAAIGSTALAATAFAKPFIHSAFSAGTLDVGLWDHWVPGGNEPWKKLARGVGRQEPRRRQSRLHHLAGRQAQPSRSRPRRRPGPGMTSCASATRSPAPMPKNSNRSMRSPPL